MLQRERNRKNQNRLLRRQMVSSPRPKSVLPTYSIPQVHKVGGGASVVEHAAMQEDTELRRIVEGENLHNNGVMEPPPLDLLQHRIMRDQDRIPHQIPKAGRIPCRDRKWLRPSALPFLRTASAPGEKLPTANEARYCVSEGRCGSPVPQLSQDGALCLILSSLWLHSGGL